MATVSRFNAVVKVGGIELAGLPAWILWLAVHVVYVVGFRSRLSTLMSWTWTFLGSWRGQLTVTDQQSRHATSWASPFSSTGVRRAMTVSSPERADTRTAGAVRPISWARQPRDGEDRHS